MSMSFAPVSKPKAKNAYEPSASLSSRVYRRLTVKMAQKKLNISRERAIISFSFDDCPKSGLENGVRVLENQGWQSTIYVACGLFGVENHLGKMMGPEDVKALHVSGHEIGEHTFSHSDAKSMSLEKFTQDIEKNQAVLAELGLPPSQTFAYPYGETYPGLKKAMQAKFRGSRGINKRIHTKSVDLNQIGSLPLYSNSVDAAIAAIEGIVTTGGWLTFFTHDVRDNPSSYGCRPEDILKIIEVVKASGADVLTINDAISALEGVAA